MASEKAQQRERNERESVLDSQKVGTLCTAPSDLAPLKRIATRDNGGCSSASPSRLDIGIAESKRVVNSYVVSNSVDEKN